MPRPRPSSVLLVPAAVFVALGALVAGRFWLAEAPDVAPLTRPSAPRFRPMPALAERSPQAARLSGLVLDAGGSPVPEALVYARPRGVPCWTVTGAEGRFELDWPARPEALAEDFEAVVAAWGYPPLEISIPWPEGPLELRLGTREAPTPRLPDVESSPLSGWVRPALESPQGRELDYEVVLEPLAPPEELSGAVRRRVNCEADGRFELVDLAHGHYRALVRPGWAAGGSWPELLESPREFVHPDPLGEYLELPLAEGALSGVLLDSRGRAVEGGLILISAADAPRRVWPPVTSDEGGILRIGDMPAGRYQLLLVVGEARLEGLEAEVGAGEERELALPPLALRAR